MSTFYPSKSWFYLGFDSDSSSPGTLWTIVECLARFAGSYHDAWRLDSGES
jgi:hypothetical protein